MELQHQNNANKSNWLQMNVYMPLTLCPVLLIVSLASYSLLHPSTFDYCPFSCPFRPYVHIFNRLYLFACYNIWCYNNVKWLTCFSFLVFVKQFFFFIRTTNNHKSTVNVFKWLYSSKCNTFLGIISRPFKSIWLISFKDFWHKTQFNWK